MRTKPTFLWLLALLFVSGGTIQSQDKKVAPLPDWALNPASTALRVIGNYTDLPQALLSDKYVNPNTSTRVLSTPIGTLVLVPNIRPFPHTATQSEIDAVTMGGNQSTMYAAWNSYGPSFYGTGWCFTNNSGASWSGNFQGPSNNGGDPGPWIWPATGTWAGRLGLSYLNASYTQQLASYSTDNGVTWSAGALLASGSPDKNLSCVDDVVGSPFFGRAYTVWTNFNAVPYNIYSAYTSDGGVSWTGLVQVSPNPVSGHHQQGCDIEVGPGGVVYCIWAHCTTNGQNSTEDNLGFAKSTNGGVSWTSATNTAVDINGIRAANLFNGIRANGFPRIAVDKTGGAYNGNIYVVLAEKAGGTLTLDVADATMCKSTDGGTTWTHFKVNSDPSNGRYQYFSAVTVDPLGGVNVSYYDQRNTSGFVTEFWMSRSINGGNSFFDVAASDHTFTPAPIPGLAGGYQGDYTGICAGNGKVWPFWADNSSGIYQTWTVGILYGTPLAHDYAVGPFLSLPSGFIVNTNYNIKTRVTNAGTSNESAVPIRWFINGTLTNTTNLSLNAGQNDSVSNNWMPTSTGNYTLMYVSALSNDSNRTNDTIRTTVTVYSTLPAIPAYCACAVGTYTPITGTGGPTADDQTITVPIGFTFNYIGVPYTQASICSNGWVGLGTTSSTTYINDLCTTISGDLLKLCPFWDDLYPPGGGNIQYTTVGSAPNRQFVVQWTNVPYFSGSGNVTMQVRLWENGGVVQYTYGPCTQNLSASGSIGHNDATGGSGHVVSLTPGTGCNGVTTSTTTCNDFVPFNTTNMPPGLSYYFGCPVGIEPVTGEIPTVYSLAQNFPNPFNPSTKISYGLPKSGNVKLVVYDLLGREVGTLVNEYKKAGTYEIEFSAAQLSSGVYFYKIEAGDFVDVKKMVLMK
jgi:type IX secretion system substrate protein/CARDB protein